MKVNLIIGIPSWLDRIFAWPVVVYRLLKYGYTYRRIPLGEGRFTIVEPGDFYRLNKYRWIADGIGESIYAVRNIISANESPKFMRMHREIMNDPKGFLVDHRNCNGLDNRRANLRLATYSQNACNNRKRKNTTSVFRGVSFHTQKQCWGVHLQHQMKRVFLGYFDNEIEAAKTYDAAARKYHKDFARLNFP
jgi:hypothetical protein